MECEIILGLYRHPISYVVAPVIVSTSSSKPSTCISCRLTIISVRSDVIWDGGAAMDGFVYAL